jgi:hypothetical protein
MEPKNQWNTSKEFKFVWTDFPKTVDHWGDKMDDTQLEILIQDMLAEYSDCSETTMMLEAIGIKC